MYHLRHEAPYIVGLALLGVLSGLILGFPGPGLVSRPASASGPGLLSSAPHSHARALRAAAATANPPLWFEDNRGQTDPAVRYLSRGRGYALFLTRDEAVLSLRSAGRSPGARSEALGRHQGEAPDSQARAGVLRMQVAGRTSGAELHGEQPQPGRSHYFLGKDPSRWRSGVPHYSRVRQKGVYPGIDLVYYGARGSLEFDFVVSPGSDPQQIELQFGGQRSVSIDREGGLVLDVAGSPVRYEKPLLYQQYGERRVPVPGRFERRGRDRIGFEVAANYDRSRPLIIDPVLNYSTFLGDTDDDQGVSIAVDAQGNTYITGTTQSSHFPTTDGSAQPRFGGPDDDVFVTKLDPSGATLVFSTFLGSNENDRGRAVAVGSDGSVYVAGETNSTDFPVTPGAWQQEYGRGGRDAFVAKLSPDGSQLVYSTFLGSDDEDWATDIAVDSQGQAHVVGGTKSSKFPTTVLSLQTKFGGGIDAFLVKMRADGSGAVFSTFLGGGSDDEALAVALDPFDTIYATGYTKSDSFPVTAGAFQPERDSDEDAFVVKIFGNGESLAYSSFFGGNGADFGNAIAIDNVGNAYVSGSTRSNDLFRTPPVFQNEYNGGGDAFVIKVVESPRLQVQRMTYVGTSEEDTSNGIVVAGDGSVTIAGHTKSEAFPVTEGAIQSSLGGGDGDAFVATLDPLFRQLVFATYLGGEGRDEARDLAHDTAGNLYVTGITSSRDFPVTPGALQQTKSDGEDAFVVKISDTFSVTSVSAASFAPGVPVAPNSIASAFGHDLAPAVQAASLPLPSELLGVRVNVVDSSGFSRSAALFFVSPLQINFLVPEGTSPGDASVEVRLNGEVVARGTVTVRTVAPALFAINAGGSGVAAGLVTLQRGDGSRSTQTIYNPNQFPPNIEPVPVNIGSANDQAVLVIFGTGIRGAGGAANVTVSIDGIDQQVLFAGDQMEYAGLDQINILLSPELAGRGLLNMNLSAGGLTSNTVTLLVQ